MKGSSAMLITLLISLIAAAGCGYLNGGDDEVVYVPTSIGSPVGDQITKEIGPEGGTISSSDGRITLSVPKSAVHESVRFAIQPISNTAHDGIGHAYRLEPSGRSFDAPLSISIVYTEDEIAGTSPTALRLAYQDEKGSWREQSATSLDETAKRVTLSTTHLSDWTISLADYVKIIPARADVFIGKSVTIVVRRCELSGTWRLWLREKVCKDGVWGSITGARTFELVGPGTLDLVYPNLVYTAPARKPIPNTATVIFHADFPSTDADLKTEITIRDRAYRATGSVGGMTFSGTVCDLEKPFTLYGDSQLRFIFDFYPLASGGTGGSVAIGGGGMGVTLSEGNGTYTVEGLDSDQPSIMLTANTFTGTYPGIGSAKGSGTRKIDLVPLDTEECSEPVRAPPPRRPQPPELKGKGPF